MHQQALLDIFCGADVVEELELNNQVVVDVFDNVFTIEALFRSSLSQGSHFVELLNVILSKIAERRDTFHNSALMFSPVFQTPL